jgi:multisubunit Na+/H+ antiporter MnhE subunit
MGTKILKWLLSYAFAVIIVLLAKYFFPENDSWITILFFVLYADDMYKSLSDN